MAFKPLDSRQSENRAALPISIGSAANTTLDSLFAQIDSVMVNLTGVQALANKTIGLNNSGLLSNTLVFHEIATPATNPPAGELALYTKSDGNVYTLNSSGSEKEVGGASGGFAIASFQDSMLTLTQFQSQLGTGWIISDGSPVSGSTYETLLGQSFVTSSSPATINQTGATIIFSTSAFTTTANTNSNNQLTNINSPSGIVVGQIVSGAGIPADTTILSIDQYTFALPGTANGYTFAVHSSTQYVFTVTSANATVGAVYSNNGHNFTVNSTIVAGTTLSTTGTADPLASGTLTLVSGTGDATITFSAFAYGGANATSGATYINNGQTYTVSTTITGGTSLTAIGTGVPSPSGTLTKSTGTGDATITFTSFVYLAHNATAGDTYTNNGKTFTVVSTIIDDVTLVCTGTGAPTASGTLTRASGSGDLTINFSNFVANATMSASATTTSVGESVNFSVFAVSTTGDLTLGSNNITNLASTVGISTAQVIDVTGIPPESTVTVVHVTTVPDTRGLVLVGAGTTLGAWSVALGANGGEANHVLSVGELASHNHNVFWNFNAGGGPYTGYIQGNTPSPPANYQASASDFTGGNQGHNTVQPFLAANRFIRIN